MYREQCDVVVASIYVNPTQFSKNEDFGVYPRSQASGKEELAGRDAGSRSTSCRMHNNTPNSDHQAAVGEPRSPCHESMQEEDLRKLAEAGCAAVFMPPTLYHAGSSSGNRDRSSRVSWRSCACRLAL